MAGGGPSEPQKPPLNALKANAMNYPYMVSKIAYARGDDVSNVSADNITDVEAITHCGNPFLVLSLYFDSDELHLTDNSLDLTHEGVTYAAVGSLLGVSNTRSSTKINSEGCTFSLSGQDAALVSLLPDDSEWLDRTITLGIAFISEDNEVLSVFKVFEGYMVGPSTNKNPDTGKFTISVETKSVWHRLDTVQGNRAAHAVQQKLFPNDRAFEYTSSVDHEQTWKQRD